jgi:predicted nucleotidyltransferase
MSLPAFTLSVAPDIEATIQSKLTALGTDHDVCILFAIESGSRASVFPSSDNDCDVRFVHAYKPDWYLKIEPGRDVIELPIEGDLDINGWDIRKAPGLLTMPNPVMLEWLSSTIRYCWNDAACDRPIRFAEKTTFGESCLHHYRKLAVKQWDKHVGHNPDVSLKKYFYILRSALAISWIRQNPSVQPPMKLQALVAGQSLHSELVMHIERLLVLKSAAKEIVHGARIPMIDAFIHDQIVWAEVVAKQDGLPDLKTEDNVLLRQIGKGGILEGGAA